MTRPVAQQLLAALDAAEASPWPHRPACQMMKPVPAGFPFPTFTCNCDMPDLWQRIISAQRAILGVWDDNERRRADLHARFFELVDMPPEPTTCKELDQVKVFGWEHDSRRQALYAAITALADAHDVGSQPDTPEHGHVDR